MDTALREIRDRLTKECVRTDFSKIIKELNISELDKKIIIEHFCRGKEYSIIARDNNISEETVKSHVKKIYIKLVKCIDKILEK